jgi:hypothetical protein
MRIRVPATGFEDPAAAPSTCRPRSDDSIPTSKA